MRNLFGNLNCKIRDYEIEQSPSKEESAVVFQVTLRLE